YTTKDFYAFEAFFADVEEIAVGRQRQTPLPMKEQAEQLQKLDAELALAKAAFEKQAATLGPALLKWEETLTVPHVRALPPEIRAILLVDPKARNDKQKQDLAAHYRKTAPQLAEFQKRLAEAEKRKKDFEQTVPSMLVSLSTSPRMVRVL